MMHDFESAVWASQRSEWAAAIGRLIDQFIAGLGRLQRRQFDAPWRETGRSVGC